MHTHLLRWWTGPGTSWEPWSRGLGGQMTQPLLVSRWSCLAAGQETCPAALGRTAARAACTGRPAQSSASAVVSRICMSLD